MFGSWDPLDRQKAQSWSRRSSKGSISTSFSSARSPNSRAKIKDFLGADVSKDQMTSATICKLANSCWFCWFKSSQYTGKLCMSFLGTKHTAILVICVYFCVLLSTWESLWRIFGIETPKSQQLPTASPCQVAARCPGPRDRPWWCRVMV